MHVYTYAQTDSCSYAAKQQTDAAFLGRCNLQMFATKTNGAFVATCAVVLSELARSVNLDIAAMKIQELDDPEKGLWTREFFDAAATYRLLGEDRGAKVTTQRQHLVFSQGSAGVCRRLAQDSNCSRRRWFSSKGHPRLGVAARLEQRQLADSSGRVYVRRGIFQLATSTQRVGLVA